MDLRTVKYFIWKSGGDLTLHYRQKSTWEWWQDDPEPHPPWQLSLLVCLLMENVQHYSSSVGARLETDFVQYNNPGHFFLFFISRCPDGWWWCTGTHVLERVDAHRISEPLNVSVKVLLNSKKKNVNAMRMCVWVKISGKKHLIQEASHELS